jgi:uncharacterized membrane protein
MPDGRANGTRPSWPAGRLVTVLVTLLAMPASAAGAGAAARASPAQEAGSFVVRGVADDDTLNIRKKANRSSAIVGTIPPDATDVKATGKTRRVGPSTWRRVTYLSFRGWVNGRYLEAAGVPAPAATRAEPPPPPQEQAPVDDLSAAPGELAAGLDRGLICYFNRPLWSVQIRGNRTAACRETCKGPDDLRTSGPHPVEDHPNRWSVEINRAGGARFMTLSLQRTGRCLEEISKDRYVYEASIRRPGESAYRGCCTPTPRPTGAHSAP